jgi:hypothetical protein
MFLFFDFDLEYLKQLQSSELLHAKKPLILLLVRFTVCMGSNRDLFRGTVHQKCGRDINCSLDCGSQVKSSIIPQSKPKTSRRLDSFLHNAAQNFELLSNIQDQK